MRAAVYTRVSTPDQSTDRQRRELRNYAKARGWKIVREMQERHILSLTFRRRCAPLPLSPSGEPARPARG
ncbi:recombinase family protein [Paraburkholderia dipogonis]